MAAMKLNVPNSITLSRIIFGLMMVYFAYTGSYIFVLFYILALLTDLLDGYFARKLKQATKFGARFDALSDNFIVICVVLSFYFSGIQVIEKYIYHAMFLVVYYFFIQLVSYIVTKEPVFMRNYAALLAAIVFPILVLTSLVFESKTLLWIYGIVTAYSLTEKLFLKLKKAKDTRSIFLIKDNKFKIYFMFIVLSLIAILSYIPVIDTEICLDDKCYVAEIRNTPLGRNLGLMYRNDFDGAMLFIFDEPGKHSFWTKNMRFPVDIIFFDENVEIVDTFKNVQPCYEEPCPLYTPLSDVMYVVEIASSG